MAGDAELGSGALKSSAASRTSRKRPKSPPKRRRGYHRAVALDVASEICRRIGLRPDVACGVSGSRHAPP